MATFQDLNLSKPLWNALQDLGYTQPTSIQEKSFAPIMSGKDVIGIAQTGTGKTLAYLLPVLRQWNFSKKRTPQIAIIVPTRELVAQILGEIEKLTAYMSLVSIGVYGGANIRTQAEQIANGLDIIVATPGRFMDLALNGDLVLRDVKKLIVDEVDEMLDLGFRTQLLALLDLLPVKRQSMLFSATLSDEIEYVIHEYFIDPIKIEAAPAGTPLENIKESFIEVANFNTKINLLRHLVETDSALSKTLIFVDSKRHADLLFEELSSIENIKIGVIHSNKSQNQRFNAVNDFKSDQLQFLVATDLISRGIDIAEVSHVINFDVPEIPEHYLHRIGRTGRADANGDAITFLSPFESKAWEEIKEFTGSEKEKIDFPLEVEISDVLIAEEMPKSVMKIPEIKHPKRFDVGPAFHEKSAKNSKVNVRKDWKKIKMEKYGKPKKKGQKK